MVSLLVVGWMAAVGAGLAAMIAKPARPASAHLLLGSTAGFVLGLAGWKTAGALVSTLPEAWRREPALLGVVLLIFASEALPMEFVVGSFFSALGVGVGLLIGSRLAWRINVRAGLQSASRGEARDAWDLVATVWRRPGGG